MAHAFNGHTFGQFIGDVKTLLASARAQERELASLAGLLQSDGAGLQPSGSGIGVATTTQVPAPIELGVASALVKAVARLRLAPGLSRSGPRGCRGPLGLDAGGRPWRSGGLRPVAGDPFPSETLPPAPAA